MTDAIGVDADEPLNVRKHMRRSEVACMSMAEKMEMADSFDFYFQIFKSLNIVCTYFAFYAVGHFEEAVYILIRIFYKVFQNHSASGLVPTSGAINNYKTQRFGNWVWFHFLVRRGRHLICWVLRKRY
jgi:hypothetical protein